MVTKALRLYRSVAPRLFCLAFLACCLFVRRFDFIEFFRFRCISIWTSSPTLNQFQTFRFFARGQVKNITTTDCCSNYSFLVYSLYKLCSFSRLVRALVKTARALSRILYFALRCEWLTRAYLLWTLPIVAPLWLIAPCNIIRTFFKRNNWIFSTNFVVSLIAII